ncbi:hypothetical protein A0U94_06705 [Gluconobacter albidus]|nr:hypothetical protein A0U94_06705 [Gluconobacter albidus]
MARVAGQGVLALFSILHKISNRNEGTAKGAARSASMIERSDALINPGTDQFRRLSRGGIRDGRSVIVERDCVERRGVLGRGAGGRGAEKEGTEA